MWLSLRGTRFHWSKPAEYSIRMKRESKALQHMMFEWTGEVTVGQPELPHHRYGRVRDFAYSRQHCA